MRIFPYLAVFTCYVYVIKAITDQNVYLRIQEGNHTDCHMPHRLSITLDLLDSERNKTSILTLVLLRNYDIHANVPLYEIKQNGENDVISRIKSSYIHGHGVYQSVTNGGYFTIDCNKGDNTINNKYIIRGSVFVKSIRYGIEPVSGGILRIHHGPEDNTQRGHMYRLSPEIDRDHYDNRIAKIRRVITNKLKKSENKKIREKRAMQINEIFIDLLIVTDHAIYKEWLSRDNYIHDKAKEDIKRYFSHVINGVSTRYKSIQSTFKVIIRLVGIIIAESPEVAPWTELHKERVSLKYQVDADTVLEALKKWVVNTTTVPEHDHVMLFTGYDLFGNDNGFRFNYTTGLAYIGTMCQGDGRSVSIVEDHGGFQSVGTATHEIGHSLGADHDGTNNTCSSKNRYIMAGQSFNETSNNAYNPWTFSRCSVKYFFDYVHSVSDSIKQRQCLIYQIPVDSTLPDVSGDMPGQEYGPDQQCRNIYGETSYLCRGSSFGKSDSVCKSMFCRNPLTTRKCVLHSAAEGTSCEDHKWCVQGHCIYSKFAPALKAGCIFGDQTGVIFEDKTCQMLLEESPGYCYIKSFWDRCCESCYSLHTGIYGCEFGDKVLHCKASNCGETVTNGTLYDVDCCGTCRDKETPPSTITTTIQTTTEISCSDKATINSLSCSQFLKENGKLQCYRQEVFDLCCESCSKHQSTNTECQYGDKVLGCDSDSCQSNFEDDISYNRDCCETCSGKVEADLTGINNCTDQGTVNHMSCGDFLANFGKSNCYIPDVYDNCCVSCSSIAANISNCNYGDRESEKCANYISSVNNGQCEDRYKTLCCYSCSKLDTTVQISTALPMPDSRGTILEASTVIFYLTSANICLYFIHICK